MTRISVHGSVTALCSFFSSLLYLFLQEHYARSCHDFSILLFLLLKFTSITSTSCSLCFPLSSFKLFANHQNIEVLFQEGNECVLFRTCQHSSSSKALWFFWGRSPFLACCWPSNSCVCIRIFFFFIHTVQAILWFPKVNVCWIC